MKKKKTASLLLLIAGIALLFFGLLVDSDLSPISIGLGSGFIGGAVVNVIKYKKFVHNPQYAKEYKVEANDPRNIEIKTMALAKSGSILSILVVILSLITSATQQSLWVTATLVGLFAIHSILTVYFINKLNKTM